MNFKKNFREPRAVAGGEQGFSLVEVLVVLAIITVIVLITATQLGNRAVSARSEGIAGAISRTLRDEATIRGSIGGGNWTADIAENRLEAALNGMDGVGAITAAPAACNGGTDDIGFTVVIQNPALEDEQRVEFENMVHAAIDDMITGGNYGDIWNGVTLTNPQVRTASTVASTVNLCFADQT